MKRKPVVFSGIAVLLSVSLVGTAIAQETTNDPKNTICRLKQEVDRQRGQGGKLVFVPLLGKVRNQVESPFKATLHPNIEYTFVGICDENCKDLTLTLKDVGGQAVASGEMKDGVSVITFTPPSESEYQVTAKPGNCTNNKGCNYGLGIFAPSSADVPNASKIPADLAQFRLCQS